MDADASPSGLGSAHRVGAAELFFDLVFVFAFTQVTSLLAAQATPLGFLHGLIVFALLWWAWGSFAWLTNAREADSTLMRLMLLAGMAGMLVVGLAVPTAFGSGAVLVAVGITVTRIVWFIAYRHASKGDPDYSAAVRRLGAGAIIVPIALIAGALAGSPLQLWIWAAAVVFDFAAPILARPRGWKVDPQHFSERYGLIVIIALGEAVVAIGLATSSAQTETPEWFAIVGSLVGLGIAALMWTLYFSHLAEAGELALHSTDGIARTLIARDAYTYAHLIPVAGIVMTALGAKEIMLGPGEAILPVVLVSLTLGAATYVAGCAVIAWRVERIVWTSAWAVAAVLALLGIAGVPSWVNGDEQVPWAPLSGVLALLLIAVALGVVVMLKPTPWRSTKAR
jgi:low temperature requirement protein LtrA